MILMKEPVIYGGVLGQLTISHTIVKDMFKGARDRYEVVIESPVYTNDSGLIKSKEVPDVCKLYKTTFKKVIEQNRKEGSLISRLLHKLI